MHIFKNGYSHSWQYSGALSSAAGHRSTCKACHCQSNTPHLRKLRAALTGCAADTKAYPADVTLNMPANPPVGRSAKYAKPSVPSVSVVQMIDMFGLKALRRCSWRSGTKGMLSARFAAVQVRVTDGTLVSHGKHLPCQAAWLVCEARSSGERKYYLTNHPADTPRRTLVRAITARWACEQAHQQVKDELGLDHYEGDPGRGCTIMRY